MPSTDTGAAAQGGRTQRFAEYVKQAARASGYDIDSPRGGGRTALARDTGMSPSSIGRMLAGQTVPDPSHLEALAKALGIPLRELLVRSGFVSREAISGEMPGPEFVPVPLAPAEAARRLGIKHPERIRVFEAMVRALQEQEDEESRGGQVKGMR